MADQAMTDADWRKARQAEQQGDLRSALVHYRAVYRRYPADTEVLFAYAETAARAGEFAESRSRFEEALRIAPQDVSGWAQLGFACSRLGDPAAAAQALSNAIRLAPEEAGLHVNFALVQRQRGEVDLARQALEKALQLAPRNVLALYNLGNLHRDAGDPAKAEARYREALAAEPRHVDSLYNLACLLRDRDSLVEAQALLEQAVRLQPRRADAWHNLGNVRRAQGDRKGAREAYLAASQESDWVLPRYALGTLDLTEGRWASGWEGYELRWEANRLPRPATTLPQWQGENPGPDARLLICTEQGFGDYIQFVRFVPLLAKRFAGIGVFCPAPLVRLFRNSFDAGVEVFDTLSEEAAARHTHHIPVMSLGRALAVDEAMLSDFRQPYLRAASPSRFQSGTRHIGFTWTGSPMHAENAFRSVPLSGLSALFDIPGTRWHSLQRGMTEQLQPWNATVTDESAGWQDFADAADSIAGLDLVVTVCTAQAHLAAALGKRVWLMSRFDADWRWQFDRVDSPWYPTVRLFRQRVRGDWNGVIAQIADALRTEI